MISARNSIVCTDYSVTSERTDFAMNFGEEMPDSRLTAPSDGKVFKLREKPSFKMPWSSFDKQ